MSLGLSLISLFLFGKHADVAKWRGGSAWRWTIASGVFVGVSASLAFTEDEQRISVLLSEPTVGGASVPGGGRTSPPNYSEAVRSDESWNLNLFS